MVMFDLFWPCPVTLENNFQRTIAEIILSGQISDSKILLNCPLKRGHPSNKDIFTHKARRGGLTWGLLLYHILFHEKMYTYVWWYRIIKIRNYTMMHVVWIGSKRTSEENISLNGTWHGGNSQRLNWGRHFCKDENKFREKSIFVVIGSTFQPWSSAQLSWNNIKVW